MKAEEQPNLVGKSPVRVMRLPTLEPVAQTRQRCLEPTGTGRLVAPGVKRHGDARRGKPASEHLGPIDEHERTAAPAGEHTNMDAGARKPRICPPDDRVEPRGPLPRGGRGRKVAGNVEQAGGLYAHERGRAVPDDGVFEPVPVQCHAHPLKIVSRG